MNTEEKFFAVQDTLKKMCTVQYEIEVRAGIGRDRANTAAHTAMLLCGDKPDWIVHAALGMMVSMQNARVE